MYIYFRQQLNDDLQEKLSDYRQKLAISSFKNNIFNQNGAKNNNKFQ